MTTMMNAQLAIMEKSVQNPGEDNQRRKERMMLLTLATTRNPCSSGLGSRTPHVAGHVYHAVVRTYAGIFTKCGKTGSEVYLPYAGALHKVSKHREVLSGCKHLQENSDSSIYHYSSSESDAGSGTRGQ
jgi:hypothetical protein